MYAIIGLGNPGNKYDSTRHNVGFNAIDCLAERHNVKITKIKFKSVYGEMRIGSEKVLLVKPQTYMNNSGLCVMELQKYYNIPIENIIVIYDDIDIEFAALRIRPRGSAGSHNGMKSIIYHLQDDNFPRIRIGIGSPREGQDLANFVLSGFNKEERQMVDETIERAAKAVEVLIANDVNRAMNEYNG